MDWLTHNPIADIHGPPFLLVYGLIAVVVIAVARAIVRSRDNTALREPPLVPATFDPYEVAYLRGGNNAVIRTVLFALHRHGLVRAISDRLPGHWRKSNVLARDEAEPTSTLTQLEERILRRIHGPVEPSSVFRDVALRSDVAKLCDPYRDKLEADEMLRTAAAKSAATLIPLVASGFLLSLTIYKVTLAATEHRPFAYLILLTIFALIALWIAVWPAARARISGRGSAYLRRLQAAYRNAPQPATGRTGPRGERHPDLPSVAMVGLLGLGILSGTPDAAFAELFANSAAAGGGCGGGCGGGGCGGGGCGGGCGG